MLVVDSGGLSRLAARDCMAAALILSLTREQLWPPVVPTMVLVESLRGDPHRDANTHRFLKTCLLDTEVSPTLARRAARLRRLAKAGSAVDALLVAKAEPGGTVLTGDKADIEALAVHTTDVQVKVI